MWGALNTDARRTLCGTHATPEAVIARVAHDPARALVLDWAHRLVADGNAAWEVVDDGDIQLNLPSGEVYRLSEAGVLRLA